jgi:hypothetical protein
MKTMKNSFHPPLEKTFPPMQKVWKICLEIFSKDKNIFLEREKESGGV